MDSDDSPVFVVKNKLGGGDVSKTFCPTVSKLSIDEYDSEDDFIKKPLVSRRIASPKAKAALKKASPKAKALKKASPKAKALKKASPKAKAVRKPPDSRRKPPGESSAKTNLKDERAAKRLTMEEEHDSDYELIEKPPVSRTDSEDELIEKPLVSRVSRRKASGKASPKSRAKAKAKPVRKTAARTTKTEATTNKFPKPGQLRRTPPPGDSARIYYYSLWHQNPNSYIAIKYVIESGLLDLNTRDIELTWLKYQALRASGAFKRPGGLRPELDPVIANVDLEYMSRVKVEEVEGATEIKTGRDTKIEPTAQE